MRGSTREREGAAKDGGGALLLLREEEEGVIGSALSNDDWPARGGKLAALEEE